MLFRWPKNIRPLPSRGRRGAVTPWLLLSLTAIIGVVALGTDGGRMMEERRRAQATADAAALAAGSQLYENYARLGGKDDGSASTAAKSIASTNGYGSDGTSTVTVNIPPQSGAFSGKTGYAEVIVQRQLTASFGAIFTGQPITVQARAVAQGRPWGIGIIVLDPSAQGALTTTGGAAVAVLNAPINVNSTNGKALSNGGLAMQASSFQITGGYSSSGLMIGPINTGVAPSPDPLWSLPAPNPANYTVQSSSKLQINAGLPVILKPGIYQGGIALNGGGVGFMLPGVYILEGGGLNVSGPSALTGTGVMIYNTGPQASAIQISGSGSVALTPPTSGTYQGISIFQDRTVNATLDLSGGSAMAIQGTIYAPNAPVTLSGSAGANVLMGGFVCDTLTLTGSASINVQMGNAYPKAPDIALVE